MPSARELLEQADALMRRNRSRETMSPAMGPRTMTPALAVRKPAVAAGDFPVLTEALDVASDAQAVPESSGSALAADVALVDAPVAEFDARPLDASPAPAFTLPPVLRAPLEDGPRAEPQDSRSVSRPAASTAPAPMAQSADAETPVPVARAFTDVPVLTDAIEEIDAALIAAASEGEPSIWNDEAMRGDDSVLGPAPKSVAVIPDARAIDESQRRNAQATAAEAEATTAGAVAASTAELIEEVRMQVLQRIDMFTDTGLREQLGERLKPIVDRASAELVATINQHVGELLRTYVAEAIERELDRLRNDVH